jgi:hypothetical protein
VWNSPDRKREAEALKHILSMKARARASGVFNDEDMKLLEPIFKEFKRVVLESNG